MSRFVVALIASTALAVPAFAAANNSPPKQPQSRQTQPFEPHTRSQNKAAMPMQSQPQAYRPGAKTHKRAEAAPANEHAASQIVRPSQLSRNAVRTLQLSLNKKGFSVGHVDGIWGPHTRRAVANFQRTQGMRQTGQLTRSTLSELGVRIASNAAPHRGNRRMYNYYRGHRK
jgi:hypothetical protein